jgi:hypothetical protein
MELSCPVPYPRREPRPSLPRYRRCAGGLAAFFASTVINYIDRQTLSLLAPYLKLEYHWTNTDYANIVIAFRVAYSIGFAMSAAALAAKKSSLFRTSDSSFSSLKAEGGDARGSPPPRPQRYTTSISSIRGENARRVCELPGG